MLENSSRFLDYRQTALDKNKVKPQEILKTLNYVNEAIQSTMEFSEKEIPFPDILIKQESSGIWIDLCHKPTDIQRYPPYSTSHTKHDLKIFHL